MNVERHIYHRPRRDAVRVVDICNESSSANAMLRARVLAMQARGLDNRIICNDGPYVERMRAAGIPVMTAPIPRGFDVIKCLIALVQITEYLRREKIDLVHTHFSVPGIIGRLAARIAGVPVVVHTVHGFPFHGQSSSLQRGFYVGLERLAGRITDMMLSQNRGNLDEARAYDIIASNRLRYVGNGIDLDRFRPADHAVAAGEEVTIICVARMEKVKNHAMLFEALRRLKDRDLAFRVWLVGKGELRAENEAACAELGIADRVQFFGYRDDVPELLAQADIATLTSIKEGVPRAALEAMATGIPMVATRIAGTEDAVRDGETGYLVELDDVDMLTERLATLIQDPDLRWQMGRRGRELVCAQFDESSIIESLASVYRSQLLLKGIAARVMVPRIAEPS